MFGCEVRRVSPNGHVGLSPGRTLSHVLKYCVFGFLFLFVIRVVNGRVENCFRQDFDAYDQNKRNVENMITSNRRRNAIMVFVFVDVAL